MRTLGRKLKPSGPKSAPWLAGAAGCTVTIFGLAALVFMRAPQALAEPGWIDLGQARVRLIAGPATDSGPARIGVHIRLAPGWATYWRSPGAAGVAPGFDWRGSSNLAAARVLWPAPERLQEGGSETFGYREEVVLPVEVDPVRADAPVELKLGFDFAVCGRICVPKHADLRQPASERTEAREAAVLLRRFLDRVPRPDRPDLRIARLEFTADSLKVMLDTDPPVPREARLDLIAEGPEDALTARPETHRNSAGRQTTLILRPQQGESLPARLTLTVIAGDRALSALAERKGAD